MREGTGADRQLMVWERTQDMKAVVDQIVAETHEGLATLSDQGRLTGHRSN
jgi:glutamate---cysteine ligase / carboxylate-amine ligase